METATSASPAVAETDAATAPAVVAAPLTRDGLLAKRPMVTKEVNLPTRGLVLVGEIKQRAKEQIDHLSVTRKGNAEPVTDYRLYIPRLVAASLLNPDLTPMFPDWEQAAGTLADTLTPGEMQLLFEVAAEVNALTRESREALGKV